VVNFSDESSVGRRTSLDEQSVHVVTGLVKSYEAMTRITTPRMAAALTGRRSHLGDSVYSCNDEDPRGLIHKIQFDMHVQLHKVPHGGRGIIGFLR
jgi:hypothetical protein